MFLIARFSPWRPLLTIGVLTVASHAFADAKLCIEQNNDAVQLRNDHHLLAARALYGTCAADSQCPGMVRAECEGALDELHALVPSLLVSVVDEERHDIPGAKLFIDEHPVALDGGAVQVDPGAHQVRASAGRISTTLEVIALETELDRPVQIVLTRPRSPTASDPAQQLLSAPVATAPTSRPSLLPAYVLGGVALASGASFGYFALSAHSARSDLDACKPGCAVADVHSARTKYFIADASLGVSLAALLGMGVWWLSTSHEAPEAPRSALRVDAQPLYGGAQLSVAWAH